jgi:ATP synthase protein I
VKQWGTTWRIAGDALQLGASIVFSIIIGLGIGFLLDDYCGTFPILTLVFFGFGLTAAAKNVWREVQKLERAEKDKRSQ